jgi:ElaB/YqjD/DUF883 family membrane-anchored ribosome-binding protein
MTDKKKNPSIMTNNDVFRMLQSIPQVMKLKGSTFTYALARNKSKLNSYTKKLRNKPHHPQDREYEEKRGALCEEFCDRDDKGNPMFEGDQYLGLEGNDLFQAEWDKLKEEYKEVMETREANHKEFADSLTEDADIKLYMINREDLPKDIDGNQTEIVRFMIRGFFDEEE